MSDAVGRILWRAVVAEGCIEFPVLIEEGENEVWKIVDFFVVDGAFADNIILGRPYIRDLQVILSTFHKMMKYLKKNGVRAVRGEQKTSRECYTTALKGTKICVMVIDGILILT